MSREWSCAAPTAHVAGWAPMPFGRRPERPLFAVGDVHGHARPLAALLDHLRDVIAEDHAGRDVDLVFLGDYVDRGPDPLGVLARVRAGLDMPNVRTTALRGNHDLYLIEAAGIEGRPTSVESWAPWLSNGGDTTLLALGLDLLSASSEKLLDALGPEIADFLAAAPYSFLTGDVLCVHAGVDPTQPLDLQSRRDLVWIREPFLSDAAEAERPWRPGVAVVHGHTPGTHGVFAHRIGVDTGGFASGVFSAVEIFEGAARFHHIVME